MGRPKLLLQVQGQTLIRRLINQLSSARLDAIDVLVRADDASLQEELRDTVARVVISAETADMKESVRRLLCAVRGDRFPQADDGWLLVPADHPIVEDAVLTRLVEAWSQNGDQVVLPVHRGKRGHPVILPWALTDSLDAIPPDQGLNWLIRQSGVPVLEIECAEESVLWDVDTPAEFERIKAILEAAD